MSGILNKSITQNNKKGTLDFVTKLRDVRIDGNFKMLSLDIESLFPSIPVDETIRYATEVFLKHSGQKLNKSQVQKLFKYCTKNITFKFGDSYFKQLNGVAMGSPLAPALAEVFLTKIENDFINNPSNPLGIIFYYRFVDDIFVILPENVDEKEFLNKFNCFHKSLKFTMEHEQNNKLSFLDVLISKNNGKLSTSWYRKPSNTLMFNPWESHGPKCYKINLIRTMINRLKIICSEKFLFNQDLKRLKESFLWSGYPYWVIEKYFKINLKKKEAGLQNCSGDDSRKQIYFGFQYVNETSVNFVKNISKLISKNFKFIKCTPYYKKGRNLLSYFSPKIKEFNSDTSTGVYRIPCDDCSRCYIGETKRALTLRMKEHQANCRNKKQQHSGYSAVVDHSAIGHSWGFTRAKVINTQRNTYKRKIAESLLIKNHSTVAGNKNSFPLTIFR
jgi:hypothetical protein